VHRVLTDTDEYKAKQAEIEAHDRNHAAWHADHENRMGPYRQADADWWQSYQAFANGEGPHPGNRPSPPAETVDLSSQFLAARARLVIEQQELAGRLWPRVKEAAAEVESELLGKLRASLDGKAKVDWTAVLAELQVLAATFTECAARANRKPFRLPTITPERLFVAVWHGQGILDTDTGLTPTVTIENVQPKRSADAIRAEENATPGLRRMTTGPAWALPVSSRPLKVAREPERIGTGEHTDANLIEKIKQNAAKQAAG
jgi:hypothetical protein